MAEDFCSGIPEDVRLREIQASIEEGKMMLQVLRSLPTSEDNDAIIRRFEELVSRLELHGRNVEKAKEPEEFLRSQLKALKDKQEKIRNVLKQTAQQIHLNSSEACLDTPGTSNNFKDAVSSTLSIPSSGTTFPSDVKTVTVSSCDDSAVVNLSVQKNNITDLETNKGPELSVDMTAVSNTLKSLVTSQLENQLTRLKGLSEDAERFQALVERLMVIIKNINLPQESNLLLDISARFTELQNNFQTLQQNCEDLQNDSEFTDEVRATRLMEVHDFSTSLSQNLESTKECFCSTYYIVKQSLEAEGDGSQTENDSTAIGGLTVNGNMIPPPITSLAQTIDPPTSYPSNYLHGSPKVKNDHNELTNGTLSEPSSLSAQKAYLSMLQNQTATEQEEIARLLIQRDQLTERLDALKAAHSRLDANGTDNTQLVEADGPSVETTACSVSADKPSTVATEEDIRSNLLGHLEAKKREVGELKAQLALLRKTEASVKALSSSKSIRPNAVRDSGDVVRSFKQKNSGVQQPNVTSKARFAINSETDGPVFPPLINEEVPSSKCDSTPFQPTGNNVTANTEILYENMREARIRLEEQRNRFVRYPIGQSSKQNLQQVVCGGTSIATSQDRTTLATWGGSSPVHSSSASGSSDGPEDEEVISGSSSVPAANVTQTSSHNGQLELPTVDRQPRKSSLSSRRSGHSRNPQHPCVDEKDSYSVRSDLSRSLLPTVGHSPSPSDPHFHPKTATVKLSPAQSLCYSSGKPVQLNVETPSSIPNPNFDQLQNTHLDENASYPLLLERMNRLESSVTHLHQICRWLVLENTQLSATVNQLTTPTFTSQSAYLPRSNLLVGDAISGSQHSLATVATGGLMGNAAAVVPPSVIGPFTFGQSIHEGGDQIQSIMNRLLQQQANFLSLQNDVQRLYLQRQAAMPVRQTIPFNGPQSNLASQLTSPMILPNNAPFSSLPRMPPISLPSDISSNQYTLNNLSEGLASGSNSYWFEPLRSHLLSVSSASGPFRSPGVGPNLNSSSALNSFACLQRFLNQANNPPQVTSSTIGVNPIVSPPMDLYNQSSPAIHPHMLITGAPLGGANPAPVSSSTDQIWLPSQPIHLGRDSM